VQVLPVYFDKTDGDCRYARRFIWRFLGLPEIAATAEDEIVDWLPGDHLLGLDLAPDIIWFHREKYERLHELGVSMSFIVHDMLPEMRPDCFSAPVVEVIRKWYRTVAELADSVICNSQGTADDFVNWLDQVKIERAQPLKVGYFHLGADPEIDAGRAPSVEEAAKLAALASRPTVLMVSTIEPRKGYQQALDAFEQWWQQGAQVNLAIVGKAGWCTEALVEHMRNHPQAGNRLHWFEGASDAMLHALYQRCDLLLSASEGEGFGLPVIEAAQYGIPLLLRDLAVFREIAGEHAGYFEGYDASALCSALSSWLEGRTAGQPWPDSRGVKWLTWQQSYQQFLDVLQGRRWAYEVGDTARYWFPSSDPRMQTQCGVYQRGQLHASDSPGMLIYGPYAKVADGTYRLRAYGAMDRVDPESWLDVAIEGGTRTLFKGELTGVAGGEGDVLLEGTMTLPRPVKDLEIRVWSSGQSQLRLAGFELVRQAA
jgi:glycosyltransferase involved in cell wall biosynthesis